MAVKEVVALEFDTSALKKSLRFAFANETTVVQELIQNGRRAGASMVSITTDVSEAGERVLSIMDDGCGLENFQVLLTVASSAWNGDVKAQEGPYGMGFMSAIYAAKHVEVISRGKVLRMAQQDVLEDRQFEVEEFDDQLPEGIVTAVKLYGVDTDKIALALPQMVRGYPINVQLNGKLLPRPDAVDGTYRRTPVGHIKLKGDALGYRNAAIYLQGFRIRSSSGSKSDDLDIVHLDSTRFYGKFPDRDVVINDGEMWEEVLFALKAEYVSVLKQAKTRLPPLEFMEKYHGMARSLEMLHVFNDIDLVPQSFLEQVVALPYQYDWFSGAEYLEKGPEGQGFSKQDLSGDGFILGELLDSYECESDSENCLRWIGAFAAKAWMLRVELDERHWIYDLIRFNESTVVSMKPVAEIKRGRTDSSRLNNIGSVHLVLCSDVEMTVRFDGEDRERKFLVGEPVADEGEGIIYVPVSDGEPMYVGESVLMQLSSYRWDDEFHQDEVDEDESAINQMVVELAAESPEQQLELALRSAIQSYSAIRSLVCTFTVDDTGTVKVQKLARSKTQ